MPAQDQPHARYPHLFGVIRVDVPEDGIGLPWREDWIAGTKAFREKAHALEEASRLQALNKDKGCRYCVVYLRLVEDAADGPGGADEIPGGR